MHTLDILKQHFNIWFNFLSDEAKYNAIKSFTFAFLKDFNAQKRSLQTGNGLRNTVSGPSLLLGQKL